MLLLVCGNGANVKHNLTQSHKKKAGTERGGESSVVILCLSLRARSRKEKRRQVAALQKQHKLHPVIQVRDIFVWKE